MVGHRSDGAGQMVHGTSAFVTVVGEWFPVGSAPVTRRAGKDSSCLQVLTTLTFSEAFKRSRRKPIQQGEVAGRSKGYYRFGPGT